MREKANPAMDAVNEAPLKFVVGLHHRVQRRLILPDKRLGAIVLVPIRPKREKLLDGDDKKARLSVIIPIELDTPSSYLIEAHASRGRARFFVRLRNGICMSRQHERSTSYRSPRAFPLPSQRRLAAPLSRNHYLKEGSLFFFPSSGPI